jgi:hypothetical protein
LATLALVDNFRVVTKRKIDIMKLVRVQTEGKDEMEKRYVKNELKRYKICLLDSQIIMVMEMRGPQCLLCMKIVAADSMKPKNIKEAS